MDTINNYEFDDNDTFEDFIDKNEDALYGAYTGETYSFGHNIDERDFELFQEREFSRITFDKTSIDYLQFISKATQDIVLLIANTHPETVFCGSFALVLNLKIKRNVGDLDVLVNENFYSNGGYFDEMRRDGGNTSNTFVVGDNKVTCFKLTFPNDVGVDVMQSSGGEPEWIYKRFLGKTIKIESPGAAIEAKLGYLKSNMNSISVEKHIKDLRYMKIEIPI